MIAKDGENYFRAVAESQKAGKIVVRGVDYAILARLEPRSVVAAPKEVARVCLTSWVTFSI